MNQAALIQSLSLEANAIAAFGRALADEREAIKRQDFQALSTLLNQKMELAQGLNLATAAREAQMIAQGLRVGPGGLLVGREVDPQVAELWRKVVFFAHKAKDANELNGAIVHAHLEFTQEAIQVLRQGGTPPNEMYGRDGKANTGAAGVSLAAG
ncbi:MULTISPECIES: flagellar protein FlgN [unclassified Cupriavidus]|uniref:flagellar protein FlgN n=1 Tax=unclassified Cupriavidus TaxID=2640874 RepID=UPI0010F86E6E|nr:MULTISPECIES: flagellar protein FlgN [unclassified Cupriavidus]MWL90561.1 flagellar protein FlgN [Cupriavidus sp. SW-Y-13]